MSSKIAEPGRTLQPARIGENRNDILVTRGNTYGCSGDDSSSKHSTVGENVATVRKVVRPIGLPAESVLRPSAAPDRPMYTRPSRVRPAVADRPDAPRGVPSVSGERAHRVTRTRPVRYCRSLTGHTRPVAVHRTDVLVAQGVR